MLIRNLMFSTAIALISLQSSAAFAVPKVAADIAVENAPDKFAEGRIIVQANAGVSDDDFVNSMKKSGFKVKGKINKSLPIWVVEVPPKSERANSAHLGKHKHVKFAEVDAFVAPVGTVNDPSFSSQWALSKIQAPTAWDTATGAGVVVAVLDTGVDSSHPDLAANMLAGYNSPSNNTDTSPVYGHGTWVAGTIAEVGNNSAGGAGTAYQSKIMPIRITNDPTGWAYWSDIANGLTWAADHGANLANISYEAASSSTIISAAQYFQTKGGLTFSSAGNGGVELTYGNTPYIITMSATDGNDVKASWSSFGAVVDLSAPGVSVYTTAVGGGYTNVSGTSFSSPITAAVAALVKSANPALSISAIEQILKDSADDKGTAGYDTSYGYGRVNASKAVALAKGVVVDSTAPTVSLTSPIADATLIGSVNLSATAADDVGVSRVEYYLNDVFFGKATADPYSLTWDTTKSSNGTIKVTAYAFDAAGNKSTASTVLVSVKNVVPADVTAPVAKVVSPANGAKITTNSVSIKGSASDDVAVTNLSVVVDGKTLCSAVNVTTISCNWNTRKTTAGTHTISVVAQDAALNVGSASISVTK